MPSNRARRLAALLAVLSAAAVLAGGGQALLATCGPFGDVPDNDFCPFVRELFYLGLTNGTTPTTFSPQDSLTRLQAAAFLSRGVDSTLKRSARRTVMGQFWSSRKPFDAANVGDAPQLLASDGTDVWVAGFGGNSVSRVRASDGKHIGLWTGMNGPVGILVALGRIFVSAETTKGALYRIDPAQPPGTFSVVASDLGGPARGLAFDGYHIWTANWPSGSVAIIHPADGLVSRVATGFSQPAGVLYDGASIWVTDTPGLLRLDSTGTILQTVTVTGEFPVFDGTNIWLPGAGGVHVIRAATGTVLATLTGNGLFDSRSAAFDGQRILVTNLSADSVSLWKAADLTPLGSFSTGNGTNPFGACSDGADFWITFAGTGRLVRF